MDEHILGLRVCVCEGEGVRERKGDLLLFQDKKFGSKKISQNQQPGKYKNSWHVQYKLLCTIADSKKATHYTCRTMNPCTHTHTHRVTCV